jgi:hypothetical protein
MEFPAYGSMEGTNFPKKRKINSTPKKRKHSKQQLHCWKAGRNVEDGSDAIASNLQNNTARQCADRARALVVPEKQGPSCSHRPYTEVY